MSEDCLNDCTTPWQFPGKIENRPGLSHIKYRIGTYSDFRKAIFRQLNRDSTLQNWTHRMADDPGIALLDGASILSDILTFYQELYANEAYLPTAQQRESIADLVRLLGYRLSPGLGGKATFAFEVKGDKPVTIPAAFPIQVQITGLEKPADFETTLEAAAVPALSKFSLYRPVKVEPFGGTTTVFSIPTTALTAAAVEVKKKDRLMLFPTAPGPAAAVQTVIVKEVDQELDRTVITIEGSWSGGIGKAAVSAYKLGRSFRHFGHNAPPLVAKVVNGVCSQVATTYTRSLNGWTQAASGTNIEPAFWATEVPFDSEVRDLAVGGKLIVEAGGKAGVAGITGARPASMTWASLTAPTTVVTLDTPIVNLTAKSDVRSLLVHESQGGPFTLTAARTADPTADGSALLFYGGFDSYQQLDQRKIAFVKPAGISFETSASIDAKASPEGIALRPVYLNQSLGSDFSLGDFALEDPQVTVYGNLVEATQGKQERETVLGDGDNRTTYQTFKLPKAPLTYVNAPGERPPEVPKLEIRVNDRLWTRIPSLFGHGPKEELYIVREDANGNSWIQFGDGKTGARLPSGVRNVVALYRTGTGAFGELKPETTPQPGGRLALLDKVRLPGIASGGTQPETGDNARAAAPGKIQSLDRLVSLRDFECEALGIAGVAKVTGAWDLVDNVPAVVLTVLMESGREKEVGEVQLTLNRYNRCRGPQRFPIVVRLGERRYVYADIQLGLDPTYREDSVKLEVRKSLGIAGEEGNGCNGEGGLFGLSQRSFGQSEYANRIEGVVQNVAGIIWTKVTAYGPLDPGEDPTALLLPTEPRPLHDTVGCDSLEILCLFTTHLQLTTVKEKPAEVC